MTKKDYKAIAKAISETYNESDAGGRETLRLLVSALNPVFHDDNFRFDEGRFSEACFKK